jgi:hypothetical protein
MILRSYRGVLLAAAFWGTAIAGCTGSDASSTEPDPGASTILIDASAATAFLALGTTASLAAVSDPAASTAWDLAFTAAPAVAVNGGASGPGGVKAYCLCGNRDLSLAQVEALSAAQGAGAFDAVTTTSIPADGSFQTDAASQAIAGWYDYDAATHATATNERTWGLRLASTAGAYAKFHVTAIPSPGQSNAGPVTIQWAVQSSSTGTLGADRQAVVDLSSGAKIYVNLSAGTTSASAASAWDVALQGYSIFVNGGVSGTGNVGAVPLVPSTFYASYAAIAAIPVGATGIPSSAFSSDGTGGAFLSSAPYRYDPVSHQVYPTYDVYLVKRGTAVYKVQIASYYNTNAAFGFVTLRYAKLAD